MGVASKTSVQKTSPGAKTGASEDSELLRCGRALAPFRIRLAIGACRCCAVAAFRGDGHDGDGNRAHNHGPDEQTLTDVMDLGGADKGARAASDAPANTDLRVVRRGHQIVEAGLGWRRGRGAVALSNSGELTGLYVHTQTSKVANMYQAIEHQNVHRLGRKIKGHKEIGADDAGNACRGVHFKLAVGLCDFHGLRAEFAVGQLKVRLLGAGVVHFDDHRRLRPHVQD